MRKSCSSALAQKYSPLQRIAFASLIMSSVSYSTADALGLLWGAEMRLSLADGV
jgi:hypothetical protein